ncbi:MAG: hypothetical protein AB1705_20940 [Verrucomicrobiota bacterium]
MKPIILRAACFIGLFVALILSLVTAYFMGYRNGANDTYRATVSGSVFYTAAMHASLEAGNIEKMKSTLEVAMLTYTRKYQQLFPAEAAASRSALYKYASKQCDEIESRLVPLSSITNDFPDAKVTIGTRPGKE